MSAVKGLARDVGIRPACVALNFNRSRHYRHLRPKTIPQLRPEPPLKLSPQERQAVHQQLVSDRFIDQAPASIYATLLDEGSYLCAWISGIKVRICPIKYREFLVPVICTVR